LTSQTDNITVQIKYGNVEKSFTGRTEDAWLFMNKFFGEFLPSFDVARKLMLNVDLQQLVQDCEGIIGFGSEGAYLLAPKSKLTDNETLTLLLLSSYIGHQLGKMTSDALSKEELQLKLGKNAKITSTRLGELVKSEIAAKTVDDKYRITTFGVVQTQKETIPKIKAKT
jgi:hypothetical protein